MHTPRLLLPALLLVVLVAGPAQAALVDERAEELQAQTVVVTDDVDEPVDAAAAADAIDRAGVALSVLVTGEDLSATAAQDLAQQLQNQVGGAVLVVAPLDLGYHVGGDVSDRAMNRALDVADADLAEPGRLTQAITTIADELAVSDAGATVRSTTPFLLILALIAVVVLAVVAFRRARAAREDGAWAKRYLTEGTAALRAQVAPIADALLDDSGDDAGRTEALANAGSSYQKVMEGLKSVRAPDDLEAIGQDLDEARWSIARAHSSALPAEPPGGYGGSLFDPLSGPATVRVATDSEALPHLMVSSAEADALRGGAVPRTARVVVAGNEVPAAVAPTTHGGGGLAPLAAIFTVTVDGGGAVRVDWSKAATALAEAVPPSKRRAALKSQRQAATAGRRPTSGGYLGGYGYRGGYGSYRRGWGYGRGGLGVGLGYGAGYGAGRRSTQRRQGGAFGGGFSGGSTGRSRSGGFGGASGGRSRGVGGGRSRGMGGGRSRGGGGGGGRRR